MKLPHNIICLDLETTDTDNKIGSIIQLSAIAVNTEFEFMHAREFNSYIRPLNNYRNPKAMAVNKISEEILYTAPSLEEVLIMFESFCENDKILGAWGAYFDIPFLREQYKKINRKYPFSYRCFDIKSAAIWELAKQDIGISGGVSKFLNVLNKKFTGTQHNALDDIRNSIRILQTVLKGR